MIELNTFMDFFNDFVPISVMDTNGVQISVNESYCILLNQNKEQALGIPHLIFSNDNYSLKKVQDTIAKQNFFNCEYKMTKPDGSIQWIEIQIRPRFNPNSELIGFISVFKTITDKKIKEERLSQLLASNKIGTWEFSIPDQQFFADDHCFNLLGNTAPNERNLSDWVKKIYPADLAAVKVKFYQHLSHQSEYFSAVYRMTTDGQERHIHAKGKVVSTDEKGNATRVMGLVHDITESKMLEKEVEIQKDFLKSILDSIPLPLFVKDPSDDFKFIFWNNKAKEIWGMPQETMIGKTDFDLFPVEQANFFRLKDEEVIKNNQHVNIPEEPVECINGTRILHTQKFPLLQNGKPFLLGFSEDVTEKLENQQKLINSSKMATLGQMAGSIAHEINNPLAVITMIAGQMKRNLNNNNLKPEDAVEFLNKIEKTSMRIAQIIRGLKTISRDGSSDPMTATSLDSIIEDTLDFCKANLTSLGIKLEVTNFIKDIKINCRPTEISQVLLNLINNARDAIMTLPDPWIKLNVQIRNNQVEMVLADSGLGIPAEIKSKIMTPFFTTKESGLGTGLGLSISQQIITNHGGSLELDCSQPHTCFKINLPIL